MTRRAPLALLDLLERVASRVVERQQRLRRLRRHWRGEQRGERTWPLVYSPLERTRPREQATQHR